MLIDEAIAKVKGAPEIIIPEGLDLESPIRKLGMYVKRAYNNPNSNEKMIKGFLPTQDEITSLYNVYTDIVTYHTPLKDITTKSKNVVTILKGFGFLIKNLGGDNWSLTDDETEATNESVDVLETVIKKFYPIKESNNTNAAVKSLGQYLDGVYNKGERWSVNNISPTMGEVAELYDVYKNIVHDHVDLKAITTISKNVSDILKSFGFNVVEDGVGWALAEGYETGRTNYPKWVDKIFMDRMGCLPKEYGRILDVYELKDCCEITFNVGGDAVTYRINTDGTIGER